MGTGTGMGMGTGMGHSVADRALKTLKHPVLLIPKITCHLDSSPNIINPPIPPHPVDPLHSRRQIEFQLAQVASQCRR